MYEFIETVLREDRGCKFLQRFFVREVAPFISKVGEKETGRIFGLSQGFMRLVKHFGRRSLKERAERKSLVLSLPK
jgi:hypothetical protein